MGNKDSRNVFAISKYCSTIKRLYILLLICFWNICGTKAILVTFYVQNCNVTVFIRSVFTFSARIFPLKMNLMTVIMCRPIGNPSLKLGVFMYFEQRCIRCWTSLEMCANLFSFIVRNRKMKKKSVFTCVTYCQETLSKSRSKVLIHVRRPLM